MTHPYLAVLARASELIATGNGDVLVVLSDDISEIPGEQGDDGVRAVAAIDVIRDLADRYEEGIEPVEVEEVLQWQIEKDPDTGEFRIRCPHCRDLDCIKEVDKGERWLDVLTSFDRDDAVAISTDETWGDSESDGWVCASCSSGVDWKQFDHHYWGGSLHRTNTYVVGVRRDVLKARYQNPHEWRTHHGPWFPTDPRPALELDRTPGTPMRLWRTLIQSNLT